MVLVVMVVVMVMVAVMVVADLKGKWPGGAVVVVVMVAVMEVADLKGKWPSGGGGGGGPPVTARGTNRRVGRSGPAAGSGWAHHTFLVISGHTSTQLSIKHFSSILHLSLLHNTAKQYPTVTSDFGECCV